LIKEKFAKGGLSVSQRDPEYRTVLSVGSSFCFFWVPSRPLSDMSVSDDDSQSPHRFFWVNPTTHTARILIYASDLPVGPLVAPRGDSEFSVGPDFFENVRRKNFAPTAPPGASDGIVTQVRGTYVTRLKFLTNMPSTHVY
jgi:hypothetical protein